MRTRPQHRRSRRQPGQELSGAQHHQDERQRTNKWDDLSSHVTRSASARRARATPTRTRPPAESTRARPSVDRAHGQQAERERRDDHQHLQRLGKPLQERKHLRSPFVYLSHDQAARQARTAGDGSDDPPTAPVEPPAIRIPQAWSDGHLPARAGDDETIRSRSFSDTYRTKPNDAPKLPFGGAISTTSATRSNGFGRTGDG